MEEQSKTLLLDMRENYRKSGRGRFVRFASFNSRKLGLYIGLDEKLESGRSNDEESFLWSLGVSHQSMEMKPGSRYDDICIRNVDFRIDTVVEIDPYDMRIYFRGTHDINDPMIKHDHRTQTIKRGSAWYGDPKKQIDALFHEFVFSLDKYYNDTLMEDYSRHILEEPLKTIKSTII